jgi:hypothetical protein
MHRISRKFGVNIDYTSKMVGGLGLSHHTHFLEARTTLFELINKFNVNFQTLSSFQKIFWTFNCENIDILNNPSRLQFMQGPGDLPSCTR